MAEAEAIADFDSVRDMLSYVAEERGDWAGIPMPLEDETLVIEPSFNPVFAAAFGPPSRELPEGVAVRNVFWSTRMRCEVYVFERDGKVDYRILPGANSLGHALQTLGCSQAWGVQQEARAMDTLQSMLKPHTFHHYAMTGTFLEHSERSGLMYLFRRLRPTVVIKMQDPECRIMCTLCLHPIAHYSGSWAGAMCPTDDVIAHLVLMRGDEVMFWRRANQHPAYRPESGL